MNIIGAIRSNEMQLSARFARPSLSARDIIARLRACARGQREGLRARLGPSTRSGRPPILSGGPSIVRRTFSSVRRTINSVRRTFSSDILSTNALLEYWNEKERNGIHSAVMLYGRRHYKLHYSEIDQLCEGYCCYNLAFLLDRINITIGW